MIFGQCDTCYIFFYLFIILSKYILNSVGETGQTSSTLILISDSFDYLEFNFIYILFCAFMSTIALIMSGIFLDFRI
jgi:hypothetical protein